MALSDRIDAGAVDLGDISSDMKAETKDSSRQRIEADVERREHIEGEVELHEKRRTAHEGDIAVANPLDDLELRPAPESQYKADDESERKSSKSRFDGHHQPAHELRQNLDEEAKVEHSRTSSRDSAPHDSRRGARAK